MKDSSLGGVDDVEKDEVVFDTGGRGARVSSSNTRDMGNDIYDDDQVEVYAASGQSVI